ncbi:unnamed protein product [Pleuronectes platessa]|uniref:Uncharacterized protein n=1 Tax=Pleuronectes platessa TaxID=8262 RepID=A0A9N7V3C5_PLEPL|nr:unnamed protein product [Pleuronectes platessa]
MKVKYIIKIKEESQTKVSLVLLFFHPETSTSHPHPGNETGSRSPLNETGKGGCVSSYRFNVAEVLPGMEDVFRLVLHLMKRPELCHGSRKCAVACVVSQIARVAFAVSPLEWLCSRASPPSSTLQLLLGDFLPCDAQQINRGLRRSNAASDSLALKAKGLPDDGGDETSAVEVQMVALGTLDPVEAEKYDFNLTSASGQEELRVHARYRCQALFSSCVVWKVSVCQAIKRCLSALPLYHVWLVSSHHCCLVFGRASRASMEKGRRAVCAQPGHLAAQRGRGCGGRWSRGSGSETPHWFLCDGVCMICYLAATHLSSSCHGLTSRLCSAVDGLWLSTPAWKLRDITYGSPREQTIGNSYVMEETKKELKGE